MDHEDAHWFDLSDDEDLDSWFAPAPGELDRAIGDPTRPTTADIASTIAASMRRTRHNRNRVVVQEAVFPVGLVPRQGTQQGRGPGASRPDVSFVGRDTRRVNLEVDNDRRRSRRHVVDHLRAMNVAHRSGLNPVDNTRSVFVETAPDGTVRRIRYAQYRVQQGRVVRDPQRSYTRTYRGNRPTIAQALRQGLFDRQPARRSRTVRRNLRPFDGFLAAPTAYATPDSLWANA